MMCSAFDAAPGGHGGARGAGRRGGLVGPPHRRAVSGPGAAAAGAGPGDPGSVPGRSLWRAVDPAPQVGCHRILTAQGSSDRPGSPQEGWPMWTSCPMVLDAPVTILGLEPDDFAVVAATPLLLALVLDAVASFGGALLLGAGVYLAKRGRPPGRLAASPACAGTDALCQACCRPDGSATPPGKGGPMTPSSPPVNLWGHLAAKAARLELAVGAPEPHGVAAGGDARLVCLARPAGALHSAWRARALPAWGDPGCRRHGLCQPVAHGPLHLYPGHRQGGPCPDPDGVASHA